MAYAALNPANEFTNMGNIPRSAFMGNSSRIPITSNIPQFQSTALTPVSGYTAMAKNMYFNPNKMYRNASHAQASLPPSSALTDIGDPGTWEGTFEDVTNKIGSINNLNGTPKSNASALLGNAADVVAGATNVAETADDIANAAGKKFNFKNIVGFDKGKGLTIGGKNIGKMVPYGVGIYQGLDALGGMSEMSNLNKDVDDLTNRILTSASGNPLLQSYLTSEDLSLLGKLQRGNYDASGSFGDATSNLANLLTSAGSGALMGAAGGIPGAIVGGIGGLINGGIDNINAETTNNTARLESLYQNLLNAEQQYKSMRRPNFNGLGIQQRYQNMYM